MNAPLHHPQSGIPVAWRERPFDGAVRRHMVVRGLDEKRWPTVGEIVATTPDLPDYFEIDGEVRINGELVPRGCWHLVRPKLDRRRDVAITLHMPLRFGGGSAGGGQKNTLALIATIAVFLVAAIVSGGALGLGAVGFLSAGSVNALAGAAVGIVGSLLIGALTKPPTLPASVPQPDAAITTAQGNAVSLSGNVLAPGASVPRIIGTHQAFPPMLCEPLIELIGDNEYGEVVYGFAGPHAMSDARSGNVPIASILEIDAELQEGKQDSPIQSLVTRQGKTIQPGIELSRHLVDKTTQYYLQSQTDPDSSSPQWHRVVTRVSPDEVWLTLAFPEGLFVENAPTAVVNIPVRVRIRKRGDVAWINMPEVHFTANKPGPFQKMVRIHWAAMPAAPNLPALNQCPVFAFKHVPGQSVKTPATTGWDADASFSAGAGNDALSQSLIATSNVRNTELYAEKVIFYLDSGTFPKGVYEIEIKAGAPYLSASFTVAGYLYTTVFDITPAVYDFFAYFLGVSFLQIPIDQSQSHNRIGISRVSSVWNQNPISVSDAFATLSIRIHGRALDQVSVVASAYTYDWDGVGWNTLTTTSNPAPHFRDVLAGRQSANPMPVDMVDDASLVAWRTQCISKGYTCNMVVDGRSAADVLAVIAACGYAHPRMSESWGVLVDKDVSAQAPVQIFSPRNMKSFRFERAFALMPTAMRIRFDDSSNDYIETSIVVPNPHAPPDQPVRIDETRYDGLVTQADATARALFDMGQLFYRLVYFFGDASVESLVAQRGDLVGVQHDVITQVGGFSRVQAITKDGSNNITGITLDGTIPIASEDAWSNTAAAWSSYSSAWLAPNTGIAIRLTDQTSIVKQVTGAAGDTKQLTIAVPFVDPGTLLPECLVTSGRLGSEYSRLLVFDVAPSADMGATLTFVPEAPQLWQ